MKPLQKVRPAPADLSGVRASSDIVAGASGTAVSHS